MNRYAPELIGSNFGFQNYSLDYFIGGMAELGLKTIEFWAIQEHFDFLGGGTSASAQIVRKLGSSGLEVHCLTIEQVMYPINIASTDTDFRRRSIDHFKRAAELASDLAAPLMFVTTGRGLLDIPREETWKRSVASMQEIVQYAGTRGVTCVLEPLQPHESELVNSVSDLAQFLVEVDDARLQVVLDTVAMAVAGDTVEDYFTAFGDKIGHVQFVDGTPAGHLAWGKGNLALDEYARQIQRHGYRGKVAFEVFGPTSYRRAPVVGLKSCLESYTLAVGVNDGGVPR